MNILFVNNNFFRLFFFYRFVYYDFVLLTVPGTYEFRLSAECHSYPVPRALFNSKCMYAKFRSLSLDARPLCAHTLNAFIKQPPDTYLQCYRETTVDLTYHHPHYQDHRHHLIHCHHSVGR